MSSDAIKAAQLVLRAAQPALVPDGWWGSYSAQAYSAAPANVRSAVDATLSVFGLSVATLSQRRAQLDSSQALAGANWIDAEKVNALIARASATTGVETGVLQRFLELEAAKKTVDGRRYYNTRSVSPNGKYHGLFQMGKDAWADAFKEQPEIGDFVSNRYDPWLNTLAGARYARVNTGYLRAAGYSGPITAEVLYSAHNQGAAGFMRLLRERRSTSALQVQSKDARRVVSVALAQNGVTLA